MSIIKFNFNLWFKQLALLLERLNILYSSLFAIHSNNG